MNKSLHYRNNEVLKALGKKVRTYRKQKGLSIEEFANSITTTEVHATQISRIERGETNVTLSYVALLADELNVTLKELIDF